MNQARNGAFALKMRELPRIPETGVEPVYPKGCQILSLVRLPFRHSGMLSNVYPMSIKTSATSQKQFITPSYKLSISTQRAFQSIEQQLIRQIFGNPSSLINSKQSSPRPISARHLWVLWLFCGKQAFHSFVFQAFLWLSTQRNKLGNALFPVIGKDMTFLDFPWFLW